MKLLNVEVVLNREKDIQQVKSEDGILEELDDETTSYAILSHRWGVEVTYKEMIGFMKMEEWKRDEVRKRYGYQKIIKSCEQAKEDGYQWLWIDTCCIDKRSSAELSEAINAMYRWYQNAQQVSPVQWLAGVVLEVEFFNKDWVPIGNKQHLAPVLKYITEIPLGVLTDGLTGKRLSVAHIMSWAARRKTTRVEDRAYSLMGLFGVNMPMLYGEGKKAFRRLQLEIIKETGDQTVLAEDPSDFRDCGHLRKVEPDKFVDRLIEEYTNNPQGVDVRHDRQTHWNKLVALRDAAYSQQFGTFIVSNAGIQVCLPAIPLPDSPSHFRATLACTRYDELATVDLVSSGSSFDRIPRVDSTSTTCPEFKTIYLTHHQDVNEKRREFTLDDKHASFHGFTRCGTYPHKFRGNAVTLLSLTDGLIVIVYANNDARSRFAVGLGYYLDQGWVHVVYDRHFPTADEDWTGFGRRAYDRMWKARAKHAQSMPKREHAHNNDHFTKHAHLPRSIWAARVVWGRWERGNFKVVVDVEQCPGCCEGPCRWTTTDNDRGGLAMPGLMKTVGGEYSLKLDGWKARFEKCSGQRLALGDYGDYSDGVLIRTGNIFEDMRTLDIDPEDAAYFPVVSRVSGWEWRMHYMRNQGNVAVAHGATATTYLALHQPMGVSLPANDDIVLLLKTLSTCLVGKHLVTTVIECSDFYTVDHVGNRRDSENESALVSDSVGPSTEAGMLTPLCTIASPQVWRRHPACKRRKGQFGRIREHFYALMNMCQRTGTEAHRKFVVRWSIVKHV
ncbi:hypothetical protein EDC04DRAFT_3147143, partial [Pisolithus marmoratus]